MRKLMAGLIAVGLVAGAAPAQAQTADPLGLIASGAVIPYVGVTGIRVVNSLTGELTSTFQNVGSLAILEVSSPVGSNAPPEESVFGAQPFHMFFFDQFCVRQGPSVGNPLTVNDADLLNLNLIGNIPGAGLIAAAAVDNSGGVSDVLSPLDNAVHARVYWINAVDGVLSRILEPISINNPEAISANAIWNPLRTGATFTAPLEGSGVRTTVYFVCPTQNIIPGVFPESFGVAPFFTNTVAQISSLSATIPVTANGTTPFAPSGTAYICTGTTTAGPCTDAFTYTGVTSGSFTGVSGIGGVYASNRAISPVPIAASGAEVFPRLDPTPVAGNGSTPLFLRIYDDEENFRRDVDIFCRCWGAHPVTGIDPIYSNPIEAPRGTYTEVEGVAACGTTGANANCSFTGYRAIQWGPGVVGNDIFGRLSNASFLSLQGIPPVNLGAGFAVPIR